MNAPFFKFGLFGDEASLIVAFVIGIGFGFFLERAGFGSAKKLTDQFYFRSTAAWSTCSARRALKTNCAAPPNTPASSKASRKSCPT